MDLNQKIEYAKKRIEELTILISYWEKDKESKSLEGLKLTPKDYQQLKETTKEEYLHYCSNVNQS